MVGDWKLPGEFESVVANHHEARFTDGVWNLPVHAPIYAKIAVHESCFGCNREGCFRFLSVRSLGA